MKHKKLFFTVIIYLIMNTYLLGMSNEWKVKKIYITGNNYLSSKALLSMMETQSKSFFNRLMWWKKHPVFNQNILEADIRRITRRYQQNGFLNIHIDKSVIDYNEKKKLVSVKININEGKRVAVNRVDYIFTGKAEDHKEHLLEIKKYSTIQKGSFFKDSEFVNDLRMIEEYYDEIGYPSVSTDYKLLINEGQDLLNIQIIIIPGHLSFYGDIKISGRDKTDEELLRNLFTIEKGMRYNPLRVKQTRSRLQGLGLFRMVSINLKVDKDTNQVPVEVYVNENPKYSLNFGLGYGIEDNVRVYSELTRLRFLGGLRRGIFYVKHSALEPININLSLYQPAFPLLDSNFILNPFFRREEEPAYSLERSGMNITISHRITSKSQTYLLYTFEKNDLREWTEDAFASSINPDFERAQYYQKSSISWGWIRDSSIPDFHPREGTLFSSIITLSGYGLKSDYRFWRWLVEGRYYKQINPVLITALKLKGGFIESMDADEYIPYEERFYSGGAYSVRGWARGMLGPKNNDGDPVGGKSLIEGSVELRFPIWSDLSGVAFLDFGNVWEESFKYNLDDIRYASGIGLRYSTPVGAARLDFAKPVFESEASLRFFISLGHAF